MAGSLCTQNVKIDLSYVGSNCLYRDYYVIISLLPLIVWLIVQNMKGQAFFVQFTQTFNTYKLVEIIKPIIDWKGEAILAAKK